MGIVSQWSSLICISALICTLVEFLIPPGKIEKAMNMVLSVFMVCTFIIPITQKSISLNFDFSDKKSQLTTQQKQLKNNLNSQIATTARKNVEAIILRHLKTVGIYPEKVEMFMDKNEDNCIIMNRCKIHIKKSDSCTKKKSLQEVERELGIKFELEEGK